MLCGQWGSLVGLGQGKVADLQFASLCGRLFPPSAGPPPTQTPEQTLGTYVKGKAG